MLGDLVLLRNRSRLGLHNLGPPLERRRSCSKHVNANSNSQAQGSCQPRLSHLHAYGRRLRSHALVADTRRFFHNIQGVLRISGRRDTTFGTAERIRCRKAESLAASAIPGLVVVSSAMSGEPNGMTPPVTPGPNREKRWVSLTPNGVGGEGGIRTHDTLARIPVFETGTFNRSVTSPICARILQRERSTRGIDGLE